MRNLVLSLFLLSANAIAADYPIVVDPMAMATPPGAAVSAAYMTLSNEGDEPITITDTYSPSVPKVEMHLSKVVNDVAKMEKQDTLDIPANSKLVLESGSYHIMLMGLTEPLEEGKTVDIVLVTSAGEMLIELPIKKHNTAMADHSDMDHSNMNHDNMDESQIDQSKAEKK